MIKFFNGALLLLIICISNPLYAKTITLEPNESKVLSNSAPWTLTATCNVQADEQIKSKVKVTVTKNKGIINGKNLSTGHGTLVHVKNNTHINVSADSGTEITLVNLGSKHLEAVCSL